MTLDHKEAGEEVARVQLQDLVRDQELLYRKKNALDRDRDQMQGLDLDRDMMLRQYLQEVAILENAKWK